MSDRLSDDLYRALVSEHGHDETHDAVWPACLPVHIAMNRYRDANSASGTCAECGELWPCSATTEQRKDGIPHRLAVSDTLRTKGNLLIPSVLAVT